MRRRITYANVAATLALVLSMSGGALAAHHYLISSTKQISPKVLKKLKGKTGKTGKTGATGKEGPAGKEGAAGKEGTSATKLFARVKGDGTLELASGAVSAKEFFPGGYEVIFNRSVTECVYEATIGSAVVSNTEFDDQGPGQILTEPREKNPNGVFVLITDSEGEIHANSFHLAVFC
jgi:hypothetical protein